ncbi:MAG: 23S rRNA (adenine(2503)-C(2))-methyltransferase RlmN [Patescibacteria group bacterium]
MTTREQQFTELFPSEPSYRFKQIEQAFFDPKNTGWQDISTLPQTMLEQLTEMVPWMSVEEFRMYESKLGDTYKAILKTQDGKLFETVLMENKRGDYTICVSSQIGCAMRCTFCATGTMGLKRSLTSDEIIDQYRFWKYFLLNQSSNLPPTTYHLQPTRISNIVFMGMGEPLANYDNVKKAIHTWLKYTDLGPTHITVSSVGILTQLEKILEDKDWPHVRIAISLHSANQSRREEIVPTTVPEFLSKLADWSHRYHKILGNRRHYITYEYTALAGINDTPELAEELASYILKTASSKINIIPYNPVPGKPFDRSDKERIERFKTILRNHGLDVTQRRTMGDDIAAACGQLVTEL